MLWDLDGTLVDSAEYHWLSWRDTLARKNYELTRAQFEASFGQRNDQILRSLLGPNLEAGEMELIASAKEECYRELVRSRGLEPLPGVRHWLQRLMTEGWQQAVASSAPLLNIEVVLTVLNLGQFFNVIASAEDVSRGKPDPEIFLLAAGKLNALPQACVVVEDAPAGIEGAKRAGMRTVGVLSTHEVLDADLMVRTLDELPENAFDWPD